MKRAALLALIGCAHPAIVEAPVDVVIPPIVTDATIHGDTRWDPVLERPIAEACTGALYLLTRGRARVPIVWDATPETFMGISEAREPMLLRTPWWLAPVEVGGATPDRTIRVVPEHCPSLRACMCHELGHFVGLQHLPPGARGVMSARNPEEHFTAADRAECERIGLCGTEK